MKSIDEHVMAVVRDGDRSRYLAALLAPQDARADLFAIYGFDLEIQAVADRVVEPLAGEIRIQWWRDALDPAANGRHTGNPVADAFVTLVRTQGLSADILSNYLDAQTVFLYPDPMPDRATLEKHFETTHGANIRMACKVLTGDAEIDCGDAVSAASRAYGYVHLINMFGKNASQGKTTLPLDLIENHSVSLEDIFHGKITSEINSLLDSMRKMAAEKIDEASFEIQHVDRQMMPAFAHLASLRLILKKLTINKQSPFAPPLQLNPLTIQWRVWRSMKGQNI